jgi:hypothetical protein
MRSSFLFSNNRTPGARKGQLCYPDRCASQGSYQPCTTIPEKDWDMAHVVQLSPSKCKALSAKPSTSLPRKTKQKKNNKKEN